jgi:hypothetical protein
MLGTPSSFFYYAKGSRLRSLLDPMLLRFSAMGILQKLLCVYTRGTKYDWAKAKTYSKRSNHDAMPIGVEKLLLCFVILGFGIIASFIVFVVDHVRDYLGRRLTKISINRNAEAYRIYRYEIY